MTKKDFELIAYALYESAPEIGEDPLLDVQWKDDCWSVANALRAANPRFDHARFLAACGVTE